MMRISVALCVYNGERFLSEQLESIALQTRRPDELIVRDDGSTDGSARVIEEFAGRTSFPVQFVQNKSNLGVTRNFEQAITLCDGDVIVTADQDDVWFPEKLAKIEAVFESNPDVGLVFSDAVLIDAEGRELNSRLWPSVRFSESGRRQLTNGDPFLTLLKRPVITGATMAFRSSFRSLILPISPVWIHDYWIGLMIASVSKIVAIPEPLIQYRRHANNQMGVIGVNVTERTKASLKGIRPVFLDQSKRFELFREILKERVPDRPDLLRALDQKAVHDHARGSLPDARLRRIPGILQELASLRYWKYSSHPLCSVKDLLAGQ